MILAPNPEPQTKALICRRLLWTDDSIDRLLEGRQPLQLTTTPTRGEVDAALEAAGSPTNLELRVSRLETILEDQQTQLVAIRDLLEGDDGSPR
jgi:hypothetical protein